MSGIPHKSADTSRGVFVDTSCITPLPSSHLVNQYSVKHDPHCLKNLIQSNDNPDYWHRFTICNESYGCSDYPKNFILKVISDFVYPSELLPVYVRQKATKTYFLARNCLQAIIKLCQAGLTVPNPNKPESSFKIIIIKDVLTIKHIPIVNIEPNLVEVLKKRYNGNTLNLSRFHEDQDLQEFFLLSQPKLLLYVLSLLPKVVIGSVSRIAKIILSHNDIKHLPSFETLPVKSFKALDLSHNKIQNIEDIVPLKDLPDLVGIELDGNPLCCRFDSGITYYLYVKTICRKLSILDNNRLFEDGIYKKRKTFLCDLKGLNFANQFLEQYFTYFDELNRPNISLFYSEGAMFSLSYREIANEFFMRVDYKEAREFKLRSRNLIDNLCKSRNDITLFWGRDEVIQQLQCLPVTRHHPHSFYVDLMVYSKTQAIIHVTGVFKDVSAPVHFGFTRTFVLASQDGREWVITNDQLFVYTPFKDKASLGRWPMSNVPSSFPQPNFHIEHMNALTSTFESITGMAYEHSKRFLEKNNWNLELALKVFIDEHINDEIPDDAFDDESRDKQQEESDDEAVIITEDDILPPIETLSVNKPEPPVITRAKQNIEQTKVSSQRLSRWTDQHKMQPAVAPKSVVQLPSREVEQKEMQPAVAPKSVVQLPSHQAEENEKQTTFSSTQTNQFSISWSEQTENQPAVVFTPTPQLTSREANQNKKEVTSVSSKNCIPVEKQDTSAFWDHMWKNIPDLLPATQKTKSRGRRNRRHRKRVSVKPETTILSTTPTSTPLPLTPPSNGTLFPISSKTALLPTPNRTSLLPTPNKTALLPTPNGASLLPIPNKTSILATPKNKTALLPTPNQTTLVTTPKQTIALSTKPSTVRGRKRRRPRPTRRKKVVPNSLDLV